MSLLDRSRYKSLADISVLYGVFDGEVLYLQSVFHVQCYGIL